MITEQSSRGAVVARMYTFGMEEEYFLFDAKTRHAVRRASKKFLALAQKQLGDRFMSGMHVHVAVPDVDTRINLIMRLTPYLPLLLALSTSSPFWQGHLTGLVGYRLAAYDELPRTGLPELFRTNEDYREFISALTWAKIIPDASYIWWAIRPSLNNPTIELRVADSCTRLDDAIAIAALFRCLVRALDR